jgi:hypothetical protein
VERGNPLRFEIGVYDPVMRRTLMINYWYRLENGKWMKCWHEILDSVADKAV